MIQKNIKNGRRSINAKKIFIIVAFSISSLFSAGFFLYQAKAQVEALESQGPVMSDMRLKATHISEEMAVETKVPLKFKAPIVEIHIANNGAILLRSVRVISITDDIIRVIAALDSTDLTWEVRTNFFTQFLTEEDKKKSITDIMIGDIVTITGTLTRSILALTNDTGFVKE